MDDLKKAAVNYFRSEPFWDIFSLFRKKYESLGRIGGSIDIRKIPVDARDSCARFMGVTREELEEKGTLSLLDFEKQLGWTRFEGLSLKELLEGYFGKPLISKKEKEQARQAHINRLFDDMISKHPTLDFWIAELRKKPAATYIFHSWIDEDEKSFREKVRTLAKAFNELPATYERLPLFSQRITGNPHAFDGNERLGKLWIHLLSVHGAWEAAPVSSEAANELLNDYKLLKDDLMNFTTCANLLAETDMGPHPVWREAAALQMVRNVPLRELLTLKRVYPKNGKKLFIVENSGVCSALLDLAPAAPVMATFGQMKLAGWLLLDLLAEEQVTFYYSGDFDPEGLKMAEALFDRYPRQTVFWRIGVQDYYTARPAVRLAEDRLKKLETLAHPELKTVAAAMKKTKKAAYQEALVEKMAGDVDTW